MEEATAQKKPWEDVKDPTERRRLQNLVNQRNCRRKKRELLKRQLQQAAPPSQAEKPPSDGSTIVVAPASTDDHSTDPSPVTIDYADHSAHDGKPESPSHIILCSPSDILGLETPFHSLDHSNMPTAIPELTSPTPFLYLTAEHGYQGPSIGMADTFMEEAFADFDSFFDASPTTLDVERPPECLITAPTQGSSTGAADGPAGMPDDKKESKPVAEKRPAEKRPAEKRLAEKSPAGKGVAGEGVVRRVRLCGQLKFAEIDSVSWIRWSAAERMVLDELKRNKITSIIDAIRQALA